MKRNGEKVEKKRKEFFTSAIADLVAFWHNSVRSAPENPSVIWARTLISTFLSIYGEREAKYFKKIIAQKIRVMGLLLESF